LKFISFFPFFLYIIFLCIILYWIYIVFIISYFYSSFYEWPPHWSSSNLQFMAWPLIPLPRSILIPQSSPPTHTLHATLDTPHSALHTSNSTVHSTLTSPQPPTLHWLHSPLHTPDSAPPPLHTPQSTVGRQVARMVQ
jgi:hypothetical protein